MDQQPSQPVRAPGPDDEDLGKLKVSVAEAERILVASGVSFPCEVEIRPKKLLAFDRKGGQFRIIIFHDTNGEEKLLADASVDEKVEALALVPKLYGELAKVRADRMGAARSALRQFNEWARGMKKE